MKRITLCALFLTLFLLISCNTSGSATKDGHAAKSDGALIDLVTITNNINDSVDFAKDVKEIHTLVKSIDELAKAIGKKIKNDGILDAMAGKNGSLLAGVFQVILTVETKLEQLEKKKELSDDLKAKITNVKGEGTGLLNKLKGGHAELGIEGATDENAQKAIDRNGKPDGDKGVAELKKLNTAIDALLKDAEAAVTSAINELTTSAKP
ncbi:Vsp/OspC family lipoprotein [Borrelia puertoricensis]|uniref:Vsp/OspC family lipoprotein n=1 Tax=Borrelia puertoricensis TaxID=2756107 RepID=UPI0024C0E74E|nr:Vsp/OspC family lipoprotein [Borrelia puertoricensis]